jgi:polyisoprenoid-binding protein YceI
MKMLSKRNTLVFVAGFLMLFSSCENPQSDKNNEEKSSSANTETVEVDGAEKYMIDDSESTIKWKGKKIGTVHEGTIRIKEGYLLVKNDSVVGGNVQIDMNTIVVVDLKDETYNAKLVGHLKDKDFFDAVEHPIATFALSGIKSGEGNEMVNGQLTIKGIKKDIEFPAKVTISDNKVSANGTAVVDRTLWDIKYGSGKFFENLGDKTISDDIEIEFDLVAKP